MSLLMLLLILLLCAALFGGYGTSRRDWSPYWSWSPVGLIVVVLLVLIVLGKV